MGAMLKKIGGWLVKLVVPIIFAELKDWYYEHQAKKKKDKEIKEAEKANLAKVLAAKTKEERDEAASDSLSF